MLINVWIFFISGCHFAEGTGAILAISLEDDPTIRPLAYEDMWFIFFYFIFSSGSHFV